MGANISTRRFLPRKRSSHDISQSQRQNDSSSTTRRRRRLFGREKSINTSIATSAGSGSFQSEPGTTTMPYGMTEFKWLEGRRFHDFCEDGQGILYFMPNDFEEQDRLQTQHYMLKVAYGGNILCPIQNILESGGSVLDVGCAQGTWVLECASEFPNSSFCGIDMTPIFPADIMPKNVSFRLANVLEGLPFADSEFDLTALRFLVFAFREIEEWPRVLDEIVRVTKPGGWVQLMEPDFFVWRGGPATTEAIGNVNEAARKRGQDTHIARKLHMLLKDTGCISISRRLVSLPINWPANFAMGDMALSDLVDVLRATKALVIKTLDITEDHWDMLGSHLASECKEKQSYMNIHLIIGRKPPVGTPVGV